MKTKNLFHLSLGLLFLLVLATGCGSNGGPATATAELPSALLQNFDMSQMTALNDASPEEKALLEALAGKHEIALDPEKINIQLEAEGLDEESMNALPEVEAFFNKNAKENADLKKLADQKIFFEIEKDSLKLINPEKKSTALFTFAGFHPTSGKGLYYTSGNDGQTLDINGTSLNMTNLFDDEEEMKLEKLQLILSFSAQKGDNGTYLIAGRLTSRALAHPTDDSHKKLFVEMGYTFYTPVQRKSVAEAEVEMTGIINFDTYKAAYAFAIKPVSQGGLGWNQGYSLPHARQYAEKISEDYIQSLTAPSVTPESASTQEH